MSFDESLFEGNIGEYVVLNYFTHLPTVKDVVDVRDDKFFQSCDVDFLVMNIDRQLTWVEIKTDFQAHKTGNFVYECTTSGNIGCFEKTKAQVIAYYVPHSGNLYLLNVQALRNYVRHNNLKVVRMGDNATGYLLDIGDLERTDVILYKTNVNKIL